MAASIRKIEEMLTVIAQHFQSELKMMTFEMNSVTSFLKQQFGDGYLIHRGLRSSNSVAAHGVGGDLLVDLNEAEMDSAALVYKFVDMSNKFVQHKKPRCAFTAAAKKALHRRRKRNRMCVPDSKKNSVQQVITKSIPSTSISTNSTVLSAKPITTVSAESHFVNEDKLPMNDNDNTQTTQTLEHVNDETVDDYEVVDLTEGDVDDITGGSATGIGPEEIRLELYDVDQTMQATTYNYEIAGRAITLDDLARRISTDSYETTAASEELGDGNNEGLNVLYPQADGNGIWKKNNKPPYKCTWPGCNKEFKHPQSFTRHQILHTGQKPYVCEICNRGFADNSNLGRHVKIHAIDSVFDCNECTRQFQSYKSLVVHKKQTHATATTTTTESNSIDLVSDMDSLSSASAAAGDCRFEFEYTQTQPIDNPHQNVERPLEEEEEEEFVDLTEEVGDCGIVVATEEGLMDLDDDEQMPDTSNSIDYEENDPPHDPLGDLPNDDLHQAVAIPEETQTQGDPISNSQQISSAAELNRTQKEKKKDFIGNKPFACDWPNCPHIFARKLELGNHKRTIHNIEQPFICDWPNCLYRYSTLSQLTIHKRGHNDEKRPFICDYLNCNQQFAQRSNLSRHKKTHVREKSFICDWVGCGQRFPQVTLLIRHNRTHHNHTGTGTTGEERFHCDWPNCGQGFIRRSFLIVHKASHVNNGTTVGEG